MSTEAAPNLFEPADPPSPNHAPPGHLRQNRPTLVALVGDQERHAAELSRAVLQRTLAHELVLSPTPPPHELGLDGANTNDLADLVSLNYQRIDLCSYVLVVSPDGYVSQLARDLITYASTRSKPVYWWHGGDGPPFVN